MRCCAGSAMAYFARSPSTEDPTTHFNPGRLGSNTGGPGGSSRHIAAPRPAEADAPVPWSRRAPMREQLIRSRLVRLTCAVDRRSHRISDHEFGAGKAHGYFPALCGHTVVATALVSPDGPPCLSCAQHARELDAGHVAGLVARHRSLGTFRRLLNPVTARTPRVPAGEPVRSPHGRELGT